MAPGTQDGRRHVQMHLPAIRAAEKVAQDRAPLAQRPRRELLDLHFRVGHARIEGKPHAPIHPKEHDVRVIVRLADQGQVFAKGCLEGGLRGLGQPSGDSRPQVPPGCGRPDILQPLVPPGGDLVDLQGGDGPQFLVPLRLDGPRFPAVVAIPPGGHGEGQEREQGGQKAQRCAVAGRFVHGACPAGGSPPSSTNTLL